MQNQPTKFDNDARFFLPGSVKLKCIDGRWMDGDELPVPSEMLVTGTAHGLQAWKNNELIGELLDRPGKRWTKYDAEELNAKICVEEWGVDQNGQPQAPWKETWAVYLVDTVGATEYTFANSTRGQQIAVERLERRMEITQALKGANVRPRVKLESRPMLIKRLGITKQRPELTVIEWIDLTGDGEILLGRKPGPLQIEHKPELTLAPAPPEKKKVGKPLKPVSIAEEIDDGLPGDLAPPKS
jgi:hypothetical protein